MFWSDKSTSISAHGESCLSSREIFSAKFASRLRRSFVLFLATAYSHAVGFGGTPLVDHSSEAARNVLLTMSSAVSMCSIPNSLQSTDTIFLYSVLKRCGIRADCSIKTKCLYKDTSF